MKQVTKILAIVFYVLEVIFLLCTVGLFAIPTIVTAVSGAGAEATMAAGLYSIIVAVLVLIVCIPCLIVGGLDIYILSKPKNKTALIVLGVCSIFFFNLIVAILMIVYAVSNDE